MNLSSRTAAGRSRSADGGVFLRQNVVRTTESDASAPSSASAYAWKRMLQDRIWSPHGPKGLAARSVLSLLIWHADASGRVWLGIPTIASKAGAGSLRTVRSALDTLVRDGWLESTPQTWATLTAEQTAAGRPVPRRGDVGQAPNLYMVLDGRGKPAISDVQLGNAAPWRPGLARFAASSTRRGEPIESPRQNDQGSPGQNVQGGPRADLHADLDPKGSRSRIESAERAARVEQNTHVFSKNHADDREWSESWEVIVAAHTEKTAAVYGLKPLPPDVKREQQKALAECLDGAATDVRAKLRERMGAERELADVRRELAARVMQLYFKRDVEHLRKVKHALRDLPREFHARITEAMQLMLRESHDATTPRRVQLEPPQPIENSDKPIEVAPPRRIETASPPPSVQAITAREARRIVEVLGGASLSQEPRVQRNADTTLAVSSTMPAVADEVVTECDCSNKRVHDKPNVDKPDAGAQAPAVQHHSVVTANVRRGIARLALAGQVHDAGSLRAAGGLSWWKGDRASDQVGAGCRDQCASLERLLPVEPDHVFSRSGND